MTQSGPLTVAADGPVRLVTLNRPESLNAVNRELDEALARVFADVSDDPGARAAVLTGAGRAFCAGGDIDYLRAMQDDRALRRSALDNGKRIITSMVRCRVPVIAAVNGPAVGLGCSLVALSDVVFMAASAYLADPHVAIGLVAGDGGPLTWPAHASLLLCKEYLLTGDPITAERAAQIGLANHVVPDGQVLDRALAWAHRVAGMPPQAVQDTRRLLNLPLERQALAGMDFAFAAEDRSFDTDDLSRNVRRLLDRRQQKAPVNRQAGESQ
jgi:enoyl-CoA hydratase/carnithine racemase